MFYPPYGSKSTCFGENIVSNMSAYCKVWCMRKKQVRQHAMSVINVMTLDDKWTSHMIRENIYDNSILGNKSLWH